MSLINKTPKEVRPVIRDALKNGFTLERKRRHFFLFHEGSGRKIKIPTGSKNHNNLKLWVELHYKRIMEGRE